MNKELSIGVTGDVGPNLGGEDVIGWGGVFCAENLVRVGLQRCSCQREMQVQRPWGWKEQGKFKESRKSLCGWSITSKGHSFIEVVGDANWAKSWGYPSEVIWIDFFGIKWTLLNWSVGSTRMERKIHSESETL